MHYRVRVSTTIPATTTLEVMAPNPMEAESEALWQVRHEIQLEQAAERSGERRIDPFDWQVLDPVLTMQLDPESLSAEMVEEIEHA